MVVEVAVLVSGEMGEKERCGQFANQTNNDSTIEIENNTPQQSWTYMTVDLGPHGLPRKVVPSLPPCWAGSRQFDSRNADGAPQPPDVADVPEQLPEWAVTKLCEQRTKIHASRMGAVQNTRNMSKHHVSCTFQNIQHVSESHGRQGIEKQSNTLPASLQKRPGLARTVQFSNTALPAPNKKSVLPLTTLWATKSRRAPL